MGLSYGSINMSKIVRLETFVMGDGAEIDPDQGGVEPLACLRVYTDDGYSGLSEVFRVPPGVVLATVGGTSVRASLVGGHAYARSEPGRDAAGDAENELLSVWLTSV